MSGPADRQRVRLLIAGLGNVLLMDDGVGVHAVRELQRASPAGARVVEVGTAVLDALDLFGSAEVVVALDAVQAGGAPGTVYSIDPRKLPAPLQPTSLHELRLQAALRLLPPHTPKPMVIVLGVQPACIDYGLELSPLVHDALPAFLGVIRQVAAEVLLNPAAAGQLL